MTDNAKEAAPQKFSVIKSEIFYNFSLVIYAFVIVLGIFGNGISIYLLRLHDVLIDDTSVSFRGFFRQYFENPIFCELVFSTYIFWAFGATSGCHLIFISIDRYITVCHPMFHRTYWNKKFVSITLAMLAYCIGFGIIMSWLFMLHHVQDGNCILKPDLFEKWLVYIGFHNFIIDLCIPTSVMALLYLLIYIKLKHKGSSGGNAAARGSTAVIRTALVTGFTYIACVAPNKTMWWMHCVRIWEYSYDEWPIYVTHVLVALNSCCNPIIYTLSIETFRKEFLNLFKF